MVRPDMAGTYALMAFCHILSRSFGVIAMLSIVATVY